MGDETTLAAVLRRLEAGLTALEDASLHLGEAQRRRAQRDSERSFMAEDRARLAAELDAATAHVARLESTNREVVRRIDDAMETIRTVLTDTGR